ncbi:MAG: TIGR02281 family clan AA aspartic protease [Gammaproteobacteria bacterium]|nr:TIGR02281 family clan AA aspartic protease [Gammaproteobacteria bacterium]
MSVPQHDNPGRNTGTGMLILSFTIALIALTVFFDDLLKDQLNPNRNPDTRDLITGGQEVVLQRNRQGHYIAAGKINDIPVTFLVDTGATDVAIPSNIANQAGLSRGRATQAATANGLVTVYSTKVDSLVLGNILLHDIDASITPTMFNDTILLGMSALKHFDFSQSGPQLTIRQLTN